MGDHNVVEAVQKFHRLGVEREAIIRGLRGDLAEGRLYEPSDYGELLEKIIDLLPGAVYSWTGDAWKVSLTDGSSVESRSVSQAV